MLNHRWLFYAVREGNGRFGRRKSGPDNFQMIYQSQEPNGTEMLQAKMSSEKRVKTHLLRDDCILFATKITQEIILLLFFTDWIHLSPFLWSSHNLNRRFFRAPVQLFHISSRSFPVFPIRSLCSPLFSHLFSFSFLFPAEHGWSKRAQQGNMSSRKLPTG